MRVALGLLALTLFIGGCAPQRPIEIGDAWARPAPQGGTTAIYMHIRNHGRDDRILDTACPQAQSCDLHRTIIDPQGDAHMEPQASILIPAGGEVRLSPGGLHIMLIGLRQNLRTGEVTPITLHFEHLGDLTVEVQVEDR